MGTTGTAKSPPRLVTEGADLTRAFLKRHGLTINSFCKQHALDYAGVQRNLTGARGARASVDFAASIQKATNGEVPLGSWHSNTLHPYEPDGSEHEDVAPEEPTKAVA